MKAKKTKVKKCPFCGSVNIRYSSNDYDDRAMQCFQCWATGPQHRYKTQAVKLWNTRGK